uniref:Uncharacterized protein n=1 Tax=Anguilla anguilla TaxID=7936 RepID=A0A0E9SWP7_ANGAN
MKHLMNSANAAGLNRTQNQKPTFSSLSPGHVAYRRFVVIDYSV